MIPIVFQHYNRVLHKSLEKNDDISGYDNQKSEKDTCAFVSFMYNHFMGCIVKALKNKLFDLFTLKLFKEKCDVFVIAL